MKFSKTKKQLYHDRLAEMYREDQLEKVMGCRHLYITNHLYVCDRCKAKPKPSKKTEIILRDRPYIVTCGDEFYLKCLNHMIASKRSFYTNIEIFVPTIRDYGTRAHTPMFFDIEHGRVLDFVEKKPSGSKKSFLRHVQETLKKVGFKKYEAIDVSDGFANPKVITSTAQDEMEAMHRMMKEIGVTSILCRPDSTKSVYDDGDGKPF